MHFAYKMDLHLNDAHVESWKETKEANWIGTMLLHINCKGFH